MFVPALLQTPTSDASLLAATVPSKRFVPLRSVRPEPLPVKLLAALFRVFAPVKVWVALKNATLPDSRASSIVPVKLSAGTEVNDAVGTEPTRLDALRLVSPAPLPVKCASMDWAFNRTVRLLS